MLRSHLRLAIAIVSATFFLPLLASAQSQDTSSQSVAEAARRAREAKKKEPAKSKVLTEDDLPAKNAKPAVQTAAAAQARPASQAASDTTASQTPAAVGPLAAPASAAAQDADAEKKRKEEVAKLKQELASEEQALDLDKREAALAQDTFYSNPAHDRDKAGKDRLDALQQQITDQQGKVQELKARLAALESQKPSSPSTASSSTPPPAL